MAGKYCQRIVSAAVAVEGGRVKFGVIKIVYGTERMTNCILIASTANHLE